MRTSTPLAILATGLLAASLLVAALTAIMLRSVPSSGDVTKTTGAPSVTYSATDVRDGLLMPAHTSVYFELERGIKQTHRDVLLQNPTGKEARYWGYCTQRRGSDIKLTLDTLTFEQKKAMVILSETEQSLHAAAPSVFDSSSPETKSTSMEVFRGGFICYLMSDVALHLGLDSDGDGMNNSLERYYGTDTQKSDTDADGIRDDDEIKIGTKPTDTDTDDDCVLDGKEQQRRTNPKNRDTDGDGLCDGFCEMRPSAGEVFCEFNPARTGKKGNEVQCIRQPSVWKNGEDKNCNGQLDAGEYDPLKTATHSGISDWGRFQDCMYQKKTNC